MAFNYSAGQYTDAFSPKRLGNWEVNAKSKEKYPNLDHRIRTEFIANERGHLLPGVPRKRTSPWGCLQESCINQACPCKPSSDFRRCKNPTERKPVENRKYNIPSFYNRKKPKPNLDPSGPRPTAARKIIDPYLNYLRDIQLPTIWIVGLPTKSIKDVRKKIVQELAESIDFRYIELQEQITKWNQRMEMNRIQSESSSSLDPQLDHNSEVQNDHNNGQQSSNLPTMQQIAFDTSDKFTTEKILDLLKFAMIEALPCHGFMLDGFPCNLEEAGEFERLFYPAALGLYFVAGTLDSISGYKVIQKDPKNPKKQVGFDPIVKTKIFTRKHPCTYAYVMQVCNKYGKKIVQVIETEDTQGDTVAFLHDLVKSNLEKYSEILAGENVEIDCNIDDYSSPSSIITSANTQFYESSSTAVTTAVSQEFLKDNPPPLISCSESISANVISSTIKESTADFEGEDGIKVPWKKEIEHLKNSIQSRILLSRDYYERTDGDRSNRTDRRALKDFKSARMSSCEDSIDNEELPLPVLELGIFNQLITNPVDQDQNLPSDTIDMGALGDRIEEVSIGPRRAIRYTGLGQDLPGLETPIESIDEIGAWFDGTLSLRTPKKTEDIMEIRDAVDKEADEGEGDGDCRD